MSAHVPFVAVNLDGKICPVKFPECVVHMLNGDAEDESASVDFVYDGESGSLVLEKRSNRYKLIHPTHCPYLKLTPLEIKLIPSKSMARGVNVGVSTLVVSDDCSVLLTRRAVHMRTFPCVWVPPGGHVEAGESLESAALRELLEETGMSFNSSEYAISILGFFESCFPAFKEWGMPSHHHIVVYFVLKSSVSYLNLHKRIALAENEVDSCAWLTMEDIRLLLKEDVSPMQRTITKYVSVNGQVTTASLDLSILGRSVETGMTEVERLSTGTQYAIQLLYSREQK